MYGARPSKVGLPKVRSALVCTEPIKDAAPGEEFAFSFIGARRIKGVPGSTALFRARKAANGGNGQAGKG